MTGGDIDSTIPIRGNLEILPLDRLSEEGYSWEQIKILISPVRFCTLLQTHKVVGHEKDHFFSGVKKNP